MGLEAPASDVEVRLEDHLQLVAQGNKGGGPGTATVLMPMSRARCSEHSHVVVHTSTAALYLEVHEHQLDSSRPRGTDQPVALHIVGIVVGVLGTAEDPRKASQDTTAHICKGAHLS